MKKELIVLGNEFGVEEAKAEQMTSGLTTYLEERKVLEGQYKEVMSLEVTEENIKKHIKPLRISISKNRTQGISKWHKAEKAFYLAGGKFIDAIKRKEIIVNENMEEKLKDAELHFERLEAERVAKIQAERMALVSPYVDEFFDRDLSGMEEDVFNAFLQTKKTAFEAIKAEEARIEAERIEAERLKALTIEKERKAKEEAIEVARLKKESEIKAKHEAELKAQQDKLDKIEAERKAKEEAEKAEAERVLAMGDKGKMLSFTQNLEGLKTGYKFESKEYTKKYNDACILIDKVLKHIA